MTTALPQLADQLDTVTAQQRTAQDERDDAATALAALRAQLADTSAAVGEVTAADLGRLSIARDRVERAELLVIGLARRRQHLADEQRGSSTPPPVDDPRGIVRVLIAGKAGRHACNQPSTGRALLGGQAVDVTAEDALALATSGYSELAGDAPAWWPRHIAAHGQLAAALA